MVLATRGREGDGWWEMKVDVDEGREMKEASEVRGAYRRISLGGWLMCSFSSNHCFHVMVT